MAQTRVNFSDFAETWGPKVLPMWKPSSSVTAKVHIRRFLIPAFGQMKLADINPEAIQGLIAGMVGKGLSRSYTQNVVATLAAIMTSAVQWGHKAQKIDRDRLVIPSAGERQRGKTFTPEQVKQILSVAQEPERSLYATAVLTGLRAGEVSGLYWEDINLEGAYLEVRRSCYRGQMQSVKSRAGNRTVPLPDSLIAILRSHQERSQTTTGLVFRSRDGRPVQMDVMLTRKLTPILKQLGIPRAGLHAFRHAQASALVATGANPKVAQAQLGHSDLRTTMDLYTHIIGDEQRKAVSRAAESFIPSQFTGTGVVN